jgi:TatD DNase family protein
MPEQDAPLELIDIGANLTHESFDHDLSQVLERAQDRGVGKIIVTGADEAGSDAAAVLAHSRPGVLYSTAGIHPHHARDCHAGTIDHLRSLAETHPLVAIGETGLDFYRDFSPRALQEKWFEAHLDLAAELQLPLFLHQRDAHDRFVGILARYLSNLADLVVHCFTGTEEELKEYLEMGCHIGITGWICDERRGHHLKDFVGLIPDDRLMLETDAPYLLPKDMKPRDMQPKPKGRRNEPAYLPHILRAVAKARAQSTASLAASTRANARRFFRLDQLDREK